MYNPVCFSWLTFNTQLKIDFLLSFTDGKEVS